MSIAHPTFQSIAVILVGVLAFSLATPARAEALEPLTLVALASLAVAGIIIVIYLVIANVAGSRRSGNGAPRYIACMESDIEARTCWASPQIPLPGAPSNIPQS